MAQFQAWKIKRELLRLKSQCQSLIDHFYDPSKRRQQYERRKQNNFVSDGLVSQSRKVAIFLIYQPEGIAASTLSTCRYLIQNDYSPLVVINGNVRSQDVENLKYLSWKIIRRENFGYDFGGYQDAIWFLENSMQSVEALVILNDSIWLPIVTDSTILKDMESKSSAFTGALQLEGSRKDQAASKAKAPFFGSFFLHLKPTAYRHHCFVDFWHDYQATSNKYVTIRRGERRFSRSLMDAGISHAYLFNRDLFDSWIAQLSNLELATVLTDLVTLDNDLDNAKQALTKQAPESDKLWQQQAISLIQAMTEKQNILSCAPIACLTHFKIPYIKKSTDPHNLLALELIMQRHQDGALDLDKVVYSEICAVVARHSQRKKTDSSIT
jgi:Rhamnan synthesis protein F